MQGEDKGTNDSHWNIFVHAPPEAGWMAEQTNAPFLGKSKQAETIHFLSSEGMT